MSYVHLEMPTDANCSRFGPRGGRSLRPPSHVAGVPLAAALLVFVVAGGCKRAAQPTVHAPQPTAQGPAHTEVRLKGPPPRWGSAVITTDGDPTSQRIGLALSTALTTRGLHAVLLPSVPDHEATTPSAAMLAAAAGGYESLIRVESAQAGLDRRHAVIDRHLSRAPGTQRARERARAEQARKRPGLEDRYFIDGEGVSDASSWSTGFELRGRDLERGAESLTTELSRLEIVDSSRSDDHCIRTDALAPELVPYRGVFWAVTYAAEFHLQAPTVASLVDGIIATLGSSAQGVPAPQMRAESSRCASLQRLLQSVQAARAAPNAPQVEELALWSLGKLHETTTSFDAQAHATAGPLPTLPAAFYRAGIGYLPAPTTIGGEYLTEVEDTLAEWMLDAEPRGLILDLRSCQGGHLKKALDLARLFVQRGTIARIRTRKGVDSKEAVPGRFLRAWADAALVVLVSEHTASGAEVIAAILRQHRNARILGNSAGFGKVTVMFDVGLASPFAIDVGELLLPDGRTLHGHGLRSDTCLSSEGHLVDATGPACSSATVDPPVESIADALQHEIQSRREP